MTAVESTEFRVLVLAPIGRDASASVDLLRKGGLAAEACDDLARLAVGLKSGAGAVLVAEEALFKADLTAIESWVAQQAAWSDLPFVILTSHLDHPVIKAWRQGLAGKLQNISMLERPIQPITLTSALQAALRARHRQYEVRSLLEAREQAARELERLVAARTRQWQEANVELKRQIEERENLEASLRQSQKMEAVGQLTGGLAHDFNNMLTGIGGSLDLMKRRLSEGRTQGLDRYISAAQAAVKRAGVLTHRLLAFSRRQTLEPKVTNVNRLVAEMEELIRRTVGPSIDLEVAGAAGLWNTLVDPNQLENALLNLCLNARDAMPAGGRLSIETENTSLDGTAARERDLAPGNYVLLRVTDSGVGMLPDIAAHVFEPFFTTKPLGEGTGLGLSMIYGFARQSGGQISIHTEVGKGTTMCLYLPRSRDEPEVDSADETGKAIEAAGEGKVVLLIDDEATIRMLAAELLEDAGYSVVEAWDGPSGLRVLQSSTRIDLLVTDVGLPGGMNGRQVADAARSLRPDLKILFITGYAENAVVGNGQLEKGMHILAKPFDMDLLAQKVQDMLTSVSAPTPPPA
ncbi:PAS/PAC sensor hybrid histidine kinase [Rhodoplanes sp. Z2-YC6860]|nr:PAS/PAC sensor hybrid histidine kinase [Rhodoplanes sp. Z2-YC6860]